MVSNLILFSISRTVKEFRRVFRECKANKTSILSFTHDSRGVNLSGLAILVIVFCIVFCVLVKSLPQWTLSFISSFTTFPVVT